MLRRKPPRHIPRLVAHVHTHTRPLLDARKHQVDHLVEQLVRLHAVHGRLGAGRLALADAERADARLDARDLGLGARDGLQRGARGEQVRRLLDAVGLVHGHGDGQDLRVALERDVALGGPQGVAAARGAQRAVLVVRRRAVPRAQALADGLFGLLAGGLVVVGERDEVGRDGVLEGLLEAREVEGPGLEVAGDGFGGGGRLDGVEGPAVELGRVVLGSGGEELISALLRQKTLGESYLLAGSCFCLRSARFHGS